MPNEVVYFDIPSTLKRVGNIYIFKEEILLQDFYDYLSEF